LIWERKESGKMVLLTVTETIEMFPEYISRLNLLNVRTKGEAAKLP